VSSIGYGSRAPEALKPSVAAFLASAGAVFADPSDSGAAPRYRDTPSALVPVESWATTIGTLKREHGFDLLLDHTAVDYPDRSPRFTVVAVLESLSTHERLIVKTRVDESTPVPTLTHHFRSADWAERETYDMFGLRFAGHPDLTRIYMPQDYDGWPMRKDFPMEGHLQFRD
jgi:NADH-quinone oxidoreductase subunit C